MENIKKEINMGVFISVDKHVFEIEEAKIIYEGLKEIFESNKTEVSDEQLLLDIEFSETNIES